MLSEVFWIAFIGTTSGVLIKLASMAYKSKCKECTVCCINVKRDVEIEEKEHEYDMEHKIVSTKDEEMAR